jgi:hypothetical protein
MSIQFGLKTGCDTLQLTLGCILKHCRDHVPCLYDLPNGMTLAQHVVPRLVPPITKIFTIENQKLDNAFLHVAFRSQSLLRITSD